MTPVTLSLGDSRIPSSMKAHGELRRELERMRQENLLLKAEIGRLTQDNEDLRESAKIWLRLYEAHLGRAERAVRELAAIAGRQTTAF